MARPRNPKNVRPSREFIYYAHKEFDLTHQQGRAAIAALTSFIHFKLSQRGVVLFRQLGSFSVAPMKTSFSATGTGWRVKFQMSTRLRNAIKKAIKQNEKTTAQTVAPTVPTIPPA